MQEEQDILTVTTTVGSVGAAQRLAREIIARRLAACVQLDETAQSVYRWQGRLCEEPEVRLTLKTLPECVDALQGLFREQHPYDVPQFVAWPVRASAAYAAWVRGEVTPPAASAPAPAR
jgi:periplasmic divalent cation tolerance protein